MASVGRAFSQGNQVDGRIQVRGTGTARCGFQILHARWWVNDYIEEIRSALDSKQMEFLKDLALWLEERDRSTKEIHERIYLTAKELKIPLKEAFAAIYLSIIGANKGPRASTLIASLDKKWVVARFKDVSCLPL